MYKGLDLTNLNTPAKLNYKYKEGSHEVYCCKQHPWPQTSAQWGTHQVHSPGPKSDTGMSGRHLASQITWKKECVCVGGEGVTVTFQKKDTRVSCNPLWSFLLKGTLSKIKKPLNVPSPILPYCGAENFPSHSHEDHYRVGFWERGWKGAVCKELEN